VAIILIKRTVWQFLNREHANMLQEIPEGLIIVAASSFIDRGPRSCSLLGEVTEGLVDAC
jgi:hypothetical protein